MVKPKQILKLVVALVACFGVSVVSAVFTTQDSITNWYGSLRKPFFTPPDWIFGPVWTTLYLLMAISFFLVWSKGINYPKVKQAIGWFIVQLVLNAVWTPLFWGFHLILPALIEIILLWLAILVTFYAFKRISLYAAVLWIPYVIWVGFAVILNGSIWYLNWQPNLRNSGMQTDYNRQGYNKLTPEEESVIVHKGTEEPFSGKYYRHKEKGTYICKRCNSMLFTFEDKFDSNCGWPSFDDSIREAVKCVPDKDGVRTEIVCRNCGAHLGHVFTGERLTEKNVRYCVNSISLNFMSSEKPPQQEKAYFAGGCFWGIEYFFQNANGVVSTRVGYMGGRKPVPTYSEVCSGTTSHTETVEVVYDPSITNFEELTKLFFEIHDAAQVDRQGPDVGKQYRSAIFYRNDEQKETAEKLIKLLKQKSYDVVTELVEAEKFWEAEEYHQRYYEKKGGKPYCHSYQRKF